jgi:hypothetical protein
MILRRRILRPDNSSPENSSLEKNSQEARNSSPEHSSPGFFAGSFFAMIFLSPDDSSLGKFFARELPIFFVRAKNSSPDSSSLESSSLG